MCVQRLCNMNAHRRLLDLVLVRSQNVSLPLDSFSKVILHYQSSDLFDAYIYLATSVSSVQVRASSHLLPVAVSNEARR